MLPLQRGPQGERVFIQPVRERTREAALQAARRLVPQVSETALLDARTHDPQFEVSQMTPQEGQIVPTELDLAIIYTPGSTNKHPTVVLREDMNGGLPTY